jgi:2-keto-3-deoxy-L-fuconate dehydrogenase
MTPRFEGKVALITGAGSGIGFAAARSFQQEGAKVIALDLNKGSLNGSDSWIECDIGDSTSVNNAFQQISKLIKHIDVLVNVAGIGAVGTVETATDQEWLNVMNVNVIGMGRVTRLAIPYLRSSTSASIVNIGSIAATAGLPDRAVYSASKGAVNALTLAMAADYVHEGIRVNCINPGTADTPWITRLLAQAKDPEVEKAHLNARQPMGRLVSSEEIASAILYLADSAQGSTTGTILAVDGGMQGLRLRK